MNTRVLFICLLGFFVFPISHANTDISEANYTPLHWAAAQGYVEMMQVLIKKGYDVNAQDGNGFTPLHYASATGKFSGVEFLVNNGADLYAVNIDNLTPLTLAAQSGEQKIVDFLFVKMRSTRVQQLKAESEKKRINTDLVQAAKARAEAELLRQKAAEWTKEAEYWRTEAQKWTREANILKDKQIQIDQLAKERLQEAITDKQKATQNFEAERAARTAAERLLREQSANLEAQLRAYQAQNAALAAQRATDAAIDTLAEEFLKQGLPLDRTDPSIPEGYIKKQLPAVITNTDGQIYFLDPDSPTVPVNVLGNIPLPDIDASLELPEQSYQRSRYLSNYNIDEEPAVKRDTSAQRKSEQIDAIVTGGETAITEGDPTQYYDEYSESYEDTTYEDTTGEYGADGEYGTDENVVE